MKKSVILAVVCILTLAVGYGYAVEVTLLAPRQFSRTTEAPDIYNDTFPGRPGIGKIVVHNGGVDGVDLVSGAIIKINGNEIFGTNDFNQKVTILEASILLNENNSISVELRSKPGTYLSVEIKQELPIEASKTVGSGGGEIIIDDINSPIYGTRVDIPAGALTEESTISLFLTPIFQEISDPRLIRNMPVIEFSSSAEQTLFSLPINISIPLRDYDPVDSKLPLVLHYNEESGAWETVAALLDINTGILTFEASHFSLYTLAYLLIDPTIFVRFAEEAVAYSSLFNLTLGALSTGIDCSELSQYKSIFTNLQNSSFDIMETLFMDHSACFGGMTPKEFTDRIAIKIRDNVIRKLAVYGTVGLLTKIYGGAQVAGAVGVIKVVGALGAVLALPEVYCILSTSILNPDLYSQLAIYHSAAIGLIVASELFDEKGCSLTGPNLVRNPSFEISFHDDPFPWAWGAYYSNFYPQSEWADYPWTDQLAHSGNKSFGIDKIDPTKPGLTHPSIDTSLLPLDMSKGNTIEVSFWFYWTELPHPHESAAVMLLVWDDQGIQRPALFGNKVSWIDINGQWVQTHNSNEWVQATFQFTLPPGTARIIFRLVRYKDKPYYGYRNYNAALYFDDVMVTQR